MLQRLASLKSEIMIQLTQTRKYSCRKTKPATVNTLKPKPRAAISVYILKNSPKLYNQTPMTYALTPQEHRHTKKEALQHKLWNPNPLPNTEAGQLHRNSDNISIHTRKKRMNRSHPLTCGCFRMRRILQQISTACLRVCHF